MNLDVEKWKEFELGDLFDTKTGYYNNKPEPSKEGIPFLGGSDSNNGRTCYVTNEAVYSTNKTGGFDSSIEGKIFKGNCITVTTDGSVCCAYYQPEQFTGSHSFIALYPRAFVLNENIALFICSIINKEKYRYSYGRKIHSETKMKKMRIKLPATEQGTPDFIFMENFIKSMHYKFITTKNKNSKNASIEVISWSEFKISQLFNMYNGKGITEEEIEFNPGNFNAVQSGEENNGVIGKINRNYCVDNNYTFADGPCLTVARTGSAGYISFQPCGCVVGDSAKILRLKDKEHENKYVYLFLKTILMANKYKYTYGRKVTESKYLNEKIMLPANSINGEKVPDWDYIEKYIKSLPYGDRI